MRSLTLAVLGSIVVLEIASKLVWRRVSSRGTPSLLDALQPPPSGADHPRVLFPPRLIGIRNGEVMLLIALFAGAIWIAVRELFAPTLGFDRDGVLIGATSLAFSHWLVTYTALFVNERRVRRDRAAYRIVLVTDRPVDDPTTTAAVASLSLGGNVIALFVCDPRDVAPETRLPPVRALLPTRVFLSITQLVDVVDSALDHTDLVVVHSNANDLLELVRESTSLPTTHVLRLSEDAPATAAAGFTPIAASVLERDALLRRFGTRESLHRDTAYAYDEWMVGDLHAKAIMLAGVVLQLFERWRFFGAWLIAAGVAWTFPRFIGPARRRAIDRTTLRTPKHPAISKRLLHYNWTAQPIKWIAFGVGLLSIYLTGDLGFRAGLSAGLVILFSETMLAPGLLRIIKWNLDWNFRIVMFRRYRAAHAVFHKRIFMPALGAYGQLTLLGDASLSVADDTPWCRWSRLVLAEMYHQLDTSKYADDWKARVLDELAVADFAMFDWEGEITDNMRWELEVTGAVLPVDRIMVVTSTEQLEAAEREIAACGATGARVVVFDGYGPAVNAFYRALHEQMAQLRPAPRVRGA